MKEVLTKDNFWNSIEMASPKLFKNFCDWVDQYKKRVNWDELFNEYDAMQAHGAGPVLSAPKFHEIPTAIQFGIFLQYTLEHPEHRHNVDVFDYNSLNGVDGFESLIHNWFETNGKYQSDTKTD